MSFKEKLIARLELAKNTAKAELMSLMVEEDIAANRKSICDSCDNLFKPTAQCKLCGCFIYAKTKISSASCPIGKWKAESKKVDK